MGGCGLDREKWRAVLNIVIHLRVLREAGTNRTGIDSPGNVREVTECNIATLTGHDKRRVQWQTVSIDSKVLSTLKDSGDDVLNGYTNFPKI